MEGSTQSNFTDVLTDLDCIALNTEKERMEEEVSNDAVVEGEGSDEKDAIK